MAKGVLDYPVLSTPALEDIIAILDMSASTGSRSKRSTLESLRQLFGSEPIPVAQTAHGFEVGDLLRHDGTDFVEATADTESNAVVIGIVTTVNDVDSFEFRTTGFVEGLTGLTGGSIHYLQDAGGLGTSAGAVEKPVLLALSATTGILLAVGAGSGGSGGASSLDGLSDVDTTTQAPTAGDGFRYDGSNYVPVKNNLAASAAPTSTDDSGSDYEIGSLWIDTTNDRAYLCLDATASAAVWTEITSTTGSGDMTKAVYDTNDDGSVDEADVAARVEETVATDTDSTASYAFDLSTGTVFQLTLTANCTISFTNVPSGGFGITIELIQDGTGSRTVTWPAAVTWAGGSAPTLSTAASAVDVVTLYTPDGGTTWRGFLAGLDFS